MQRSRIATLLLGAATLIGVAGLLTTGVSAAAVSAGALTGRGATHVSNQTGPTTAGTYSGTVKQNGPTLVTHDNEGDRTLVVQSGATVMRNGKAVAISDLKKGDKLTAVLSPDGIVQRIDASSPGNNADYLKWLIPLIVAAVVLIGLLAWVLSRRRHAGFILERRTPHGQAM